MEANRCRAPSSDGAAYLAAAAKAVCQACSVRASCLPFAVETGQHGIWGGTTSDERHAMRNQASKRRITGRTVSTGHTCRSFPKFRRQAARKPTRWTASSAVG
jgi:Transcription factor WhiB